MVLLCGWLPRMAFIDYKGYKKICADGGIRYLDWDVSIPLPKLIELYA